MKDLVVRRYTWAAIAGQYDAFFRRVLEPSERTHG
jgi:hypothetical protein